MDPTHRLSLNSPAGGSFERADAKVSREIHGVHDLGGKQLSLI